ncbi:MAG: EamA family transporter [Clostridia bacterium]|nr:EamA family transporter [Clostridia bacterium]
MNPKIEYVIAMLVFGSVGLPVRFLPLPSGWIAMIRGLVGCLFLLAVRRKPDRKAFQKNWLPLLVSGIAIGLNWIFLFEAYRHTTIAVATLLYYLAPVLVMLLSPVILKEKLTWKQGGVIAVALFGMVLVSGVGAGEGAGGLHGIVMGILAACFYATVMLANRFLKELEALDRTIFQLGIAGLTVLPYALLREGFSAAWFDWRSILLLALVAIVYTGIAYALYFDGLARLPGSASAVLAYLDPVTALLLSSLVLGEKMGVPQMIGAVLILGALLYGQLSDMKKSKKTV